jgi:hypothetical protein
MTSRVEAQLGCGQRGTLSVESVTRPELALSWRMAPGRLAMVAFAVRGDRRGGSA